MNMDDDRLAYINNSSYRIKVMKTIGNNVKMPKQIAEDSGILPNHISNVLRQLKDKEIVECLNPKARKGRLYRLSDDGLKLLEELD